MTENDPNRRLADFKLLREIGRGGMGVVYEAHQISLDRTVAVKFLTERALGNVELRVRFLREARMAAALNHPAICTIHEVREVQPGEELVVPGGADLPAGTPYISMEWIDGRPLSSLIGTSELRDLDSQLAIAVQVAEGLAVAHGHGIVHRDIKPGNVMVTRDGHVKIVDFGLAKPVVSSAGLPEATTETLSDELTREGRILGTVVYMSPEQAMGKTLDARSDVFSFGTMLYEMVTGRRPFRGDNPASIFAKILESEPDSLETINPNLPPELARVVRRCLRKLPEERYNDTRDLVVALKDLRGATTSGRPVMAAAPVRRPRAWWPIVVAACAALVLVVVGVRWLGPASKESAPPNPAAAPVIDARALGYYNRGLHLMRDEGTPTSLDEAIQNLNHALRISPDWALAWAALGEAHWLNFWKDSDPADREDAEVAVAKSYYLGPKLAEVLVARGLGLFLAGDYRGAEADLEAAVKTKPELGHAWAYLGLARGKLEQYAEGIVALRMAIELEPLNFKFRGYLGIFHDIFQEYDEALEAHRKATELNPGAFSGWNNLGGMLMHKKRIDEAIPALEQALKIEERGAVRSNLGTAYYFRGRYADAAKQYQRATELEPEDPAHWGNLGDVLAVQEKRGAARDAYRKAAMAAQVQAEQSGDPIKIMSWAKYCARAEDAACAVKQAGAALAMRSEDASLLLDNAVVHRILGQDAESLTWLEKAVLQGVSRAQIELVPEFAPLGRDPRYQRILQLAK